MSLKAKFLCHSVSDDGGENKQAMLMAVTTGSEENKSFSKYTPSGQLNISISKETPASDFFTEGKEYFLTFDEVEEEKAGE